MTSEHHPAGGDGTAIAEGFLALSNFLLSRKVEPDLAALYLQRIRAEPFGERIDELVTLFVQLAAASADLEEDVRLQIMASPTVGPLAEQIMLLWYTSASEEGGRWKFGTPEEYFRADIWTAIGAHPPGLSGGYFGYWKYPPEN